MRRIRKAGEEDLAEILTIEEKSFPSPWSAEMFRPELKRETTVFLALEEEGAIRGYVCGWTVADEGHLLKLAIHPGWRRRGLGSALLRAFSTVMRHRGAQMLWLEVRAGNEAARAFYRHHGWRESSLRRHYYSDTGEDAVVMVKLLRPGQAWPDRGKGEKER